jgi:hypothetical protein
LIIDTHEEKSELIVDYSQKIGNMAFFLGIAISCFAESIFIGRILDLSQLYRYDVLNFGFGFFTALAFLGIGNVLLILSCKLNKEETFHDYR